MRFFSSLVRPDESTGAVMRWVHRIWVFFWLTALGAGIGLLSLYLTAHSYAAIDATELLQSYFKIPLLVVMNLLAPVLLVYLGFFSSRGRGRRTFSRRCRFSRLRSQATTRCSCAATRCWQATCACYARRAASWTSIPST